MKYRCFAALVLAMLLPGCAAAPDLTPVCPPAAYI